MHGSNLLRVLTAAIRLLFVMSRPVWLMRKLIIVHTARAFAVTNVANCSSSRFRRFLLQTLTTKSSTSRILKVVYTSQPVLQPVVGLQPASLNVWNIYIINKYFFLNFDQTRHIVSCPHSRLAASQRGQGRNPGKGLGSKVK